MIKIYRYILKGGDEEGSENECVETWVGVQIESVS